jgi:hypothetical protein
MYAMLNPKNEEFNGYRWLKELCAIALTIPFSTAIVETAFSIMKAVKNYRTNALLDDTLDDIMQVVMNGPPEMPVCVCECTLVPACVRTRCYM